MKQGLRELRPEELAEALERVTLPWLLERLRSHTAGHCMRVSDLDVDVMVRLCARLRAEVPEATVVVLSDGRPEIPAAFAASSAHLVELRNPVADGSFRPPLLAFVPNDVRVSAEDSFGVATFEELSVSGTYERLRAQLIEELPTGLRAPVKESLLALDVEETRWPFADAFSVVRMLLLAAAHGNDAEALGASLFEIGLVPDFEWLLRPTDAARRIVRNRQCVERITWSTRSERGRVLELGLADRVLRAQLGEFLVLVGTEDPRAWTRRIVLDRSHWSLAFNRWTFDDGDAELEGIFIGDVEVDLPTVKEDETHAKLSALAGQRYLPLGDGGLRKFTARFRVDPHPSKVRGVARFVVQVASQERGPIGIAVGKRAWSGTRDSVSVTFSSLRKDDWEDGWHYLRVVAMTEAGDHFPLVDEQGRSIPWSTDTSLGGSRPNESDLFYVHTAGDVDVEPIQRAVPRAVSAMHALLAARFAAVLGRRDPSSVSITQVGWGNKSAGPRSASSEGLDVRLGREGAVSVPVARALKVLEQKILGAPRAPVSWRVSVIQGVFGESTTDDAPWPVGAETERFLSARERWFDSVRGGAEELITEGCDPVALRPEAHAYGTAFLALVDSLTREMGAVDPSASRRALLSLRRVLGIDSVRLTIVDHRAQRREATLLAPTHPLRVVWFATWAQLGVAWVEASRSSPDEYVAPTRDALLRLLTPTDFPPVFTTESNQTLTAIDSVSPFWSLFVPASEADPRGLVGEVCGALGLPEPSLGGAQIDGEYLASRVRRYLVQHPYVRTLLVNAFNPGRATVLADMLVALQKKHVFEDLRYDVRLFVPDPDAPGVGDALLALVAPEASVTDRESDAFSTPASSPLRSKLRIAVRGTHEFRAAPEPHCAHVSLLFDLFPTEEVGATIIDGADDHTPLHGLIQDFVTEYREDDLAIAWRRRPIHGAARTLPGAEDLSTLLVSLSSALSSAQAMIATGRGGRDLRPVVTLSLGPPQRALLHHVHEVSDWVFTIDRNLGIEFFDHGGRAARPDYLIDHSPDLSSVFGHRVVITSRSVAELEALLRPVLEDYGLDATGRHAVAVLDQLRSLSGRLALKLISAPTQRAEALGLALSRLYLQYQGAFSNQIVVPLDAHFELYRALKQKAEEFGDEVSYRRTDLALFDLDAERRLIVCRLVEVKCYTDAGDSVAFDRLTDEIAQQIATSERVLAWHFDPSLSPTDRPDRALKTRELVRLLSFYLDRAARYDLLDGAAAARSRGMLSTLDEGYTLTFTRSALVFDFSTSGTSPSVLDAGIEYHRIGKDLIRQLIDAVADQTSPRDPARLAHHRALAPDVPILSTAAFLGSSSDLARHDAPASSVDGFPLPLGDSPGPPELAVAGPSTLMGDSPAVLPAETHPSPLIYDVMLGVGGASSQYGIFGESSGRRVAVDLNDTHTISLFGVQGAGKSYTLGVLAEMASLSMPSLNVLPVPLATVIFHYSPTMDYQPEYTSMTAPNSDDAQIEELRSRYGAEPRSLDDVVLLVPSDKLDERRGEYPSIKVCPLKFGPGDLQAAHWRVLMGAIGNASAYLTQINRLMRRAPRGGLTLDHLRELVEGAAMPENIKQLARMRLDFAKEYIEDHASLKDLARPGRLVIVDIRDEFIEKDEAFGLFFVLLQVFASATDNGRIYNKLFVFDEAHKYMESAALVEELKRFVSEMRHSAFSILIASQDPMSVPDRLIALSDMLVLHRFNSPAWLKHIQRSNTALTSLTPERMASLRPGEAFVWASKASEEAFSLGAVRIRCRPRVTQHGGVTRTAASRRD